MKKLITILILFFGCIVLAQTSTQTRFNSDNRLYYVWNEEKQDYDLKETEFENSIIEIREIGSKSEGYIIITLNDNGIVRLYHGSIKDYQINDKNESVWVMRSKNTRGKLMYDDVKKTISFSFESDKKRYLKIFVFNLRPNTIDDKEE
jgi:hypothetical protein